MDQPPDGSGIKTDTLNGRERLKVPHDDGLMRYLVGAFLLLWLIMWAIGATDVGGRVLAGEAGLFQLVWLVSWVAMGVVACLVTYRAFRPQVPEQLVIEPGTLWYDTGIPALTVRALQRNGRDFWRIVFWRRKRWQFDQSDVGSLTLRETGEGNRLTIDKGAQRLDLASGASDVEREWLYNQLADTYKIRSSGRV